MKTNKTFNRIMLLAILLAMGVWSCFGKTFTPPQDREIPQGPGVFSKGEDGVVIYNSDQENSDQVKSFPARLNKDTPADAKMTGNLQSTPNYEEFENYLKWLQWKKSAEGTAEYEQFQQWLQWRKYQEWKNHK